jgi:hypothetical protein
MPNRGMLNIPLVNDEIALRVVASYGHDFGSIDRMVVSNFPLPTNPVPGYYGSTRGPVANARDRRPSPTSMISMPHMVPLY